MNYDDLHERLVDLYDDQDDASKINNQKAYDLVIELSSIINTCEYSELDVHFTIFNCIYRFLLDHLMRNDLNKLLEDFCKNPTNDNACNFVDITHEMFRNNSNISFMLMRGIFNTKPYIKPDCDHGYVYAFLMNNGSIKIGKSNNPLNRLRVISSCNEHYVKTMYYIECDNITKMESQLHKEFKQYKIRGEYFNANLNDVLDKFNEISNTYKYDIKLDSLGNIIVPKNMDTIDRIEIN